jgi:hypothetical protein
MLGRMTMPRARTIIGWAVGVIAGLSVGSVLLLFVIPYFMAPDSLDRAEAGTILASGLQRYRRMQYSELKPLIGSSDRKEVVGRSGVQYQFVMSAFWDGEPDRDIRIIGSIDDGGRSAWKPMTDSFILSPSGKFVGE